jgi:hypothetical protein
MPLLELSHFGRGESGRLAQSGDGGREGDEPENALPVLRYEDV